jgi:hypothetical protein
MVSSFPLTCNTVQVGVIRRSVRNLGSEFPDLAKAALVMMTDTSIGVGWNAMMSLYLFLLGGFLWSIIRFDLCGGWMWDPGIMAQSKSRSRFHEIWSPTNMDAFGACISICIKFPLAHHRPQHNSMIAWTTAFSGHVYIEESRWWQTSNRKVVLTNLVLRWFDTKRESQIDICD